MVCDLVSENKRSSVLTMAAVMNTYKHSAERVTGRNRSHALPSKVAERLQTLKMTDGIRRAILGAIPPSRRAQLEKFKRRAADLRNHVGALEGYVPTRGADRKHLMMQTFDHAHRRTRTRTPNAVARPRPLVLMGDPGKMGTEQEKEVGKAPTGMIY